MVTYYFRPLSAASIEALAKACGTVMCAQSALSLSCLCGQCMRTTVHVQSHCVLIFAALK